MKVLETNRQVMMWLCMCPADESTSRKKRIAYIALTFVVAAITLTCWLSSILFVVSHASIDLKSSLYAAFQVGAEGSVSNVIIIAIFNRNRIGAIFTQLSKIYTANENVASFKFLMDANNKSEWIWSVYFKYAIGGFFANLIMSISASILFCLYKYEHFDVEHLYRPYRFVLPWDQDTPYGYFGDLSYGIAAGEFYLIINGAVIILLVSMCWHHQAFYERFRHSALQLDHPENKANANEILCELIRFHITVKDWFFETAKVYSTFVLIQIIFNSLLLACAIFQLDLQLKHIDLEFCLLLFAVVTGMCNLFVYCYFGMLATESFLDMGECLYESNWHEQPLHMQKHLFFTIQNMQKPIYYQGFEVAVLNLETFVTVRKTDSLCEWFLHLVSTVHLQVIRSVVTYYMAFKTLTRK